MLVTKMNVLAIVCSDILGKIKHANLARLQPIHLDAFLVLGLTRSSSLLAFGALRSVGFFMVLGICCSKLSEKTVFWRRGDFQRRTVQRREFRRGDWRQVESRRVDFILHVDELPPTSESELRSLRSIEFFVSNGSLVRLFMRFGGPFDRILCRFLRLDEVFMLSTLCLMI